MDWDRIISDNRDALAAILAGLVALMAGCAGAARIARPLRSAILAALRPAEAALRRLIVMVAASRGLVPREAARRARPLPDFAALARKPRAPAFALIDPPRPPFVWRSDDAGPPARRAIPRISLPGVGDPAFLAPARLPPVDDGEADAAALRARLAAFSRALDALPAEARRLARLVARRRAAGRPRDGSPLRSGRPPGHRARPANEADAVLADCHYFARLCAWPPP